jgi:hypothetical protein
MQLHRNNRSRLQLETLEDRITPSWNWGVPQLTGPAYQPAVQATFEVKDSTSASRIPRAPFWRGGIK